MGQILTLSLDNALKSDCKARPSHLNEFTAFLKSHCVIEEGTGAYTPFYTLCSAFYIFLSKNKSNKFYTRYDFPQQMHNIVCSYQQVDPRIKYYGFTEGTDDKTYNGMTVWNVRIVSCPVFEIQN